MTEAFERTLRYLKEREQFGVLIGTFQALKHPRRPGCSSRSSSAAPP